MSVRESMEYKQRQSINLVASSFVRIFCELSKALQFKLSRPQMVATISQKNTIFMILGRFIKSCTWKVNQTILYHTEVTEYIGLQYSTILH